MICLNSWRLTIALLSFAFFSCQSTSSSRLANAFVVLPGQSQITSQSNLIRRFMSDEQEPQNEQGEMPDGFSPPVAAVKCPDCNKCDGSGRILGGIGVVLTWWPIKAYRPCPEFVNSGGQYTRKGQALDEIAFGRLENKDP
mmetsp:Transcript_11406/g.13008  ORF Transcript_11406/g.13008 Transcript_11406/m.13008 type:complete len:141 (-) Transcript_11406:391-813(-)